MNHTENTTKALEALDDAQLKFILGRLLSEVETEEPAIDDRVMQERTKRDESLLREAAVACGVKPVQAVSDREAAIGFLVAVTAVSAAHAEMVQSALNELKTRAVKLDFGLSAFALGAIAIGIAGALVRPRVAIETKKSRGGQQSTKINIEARGIKEIADVVRAVFRFKGK